MKTYVFTHHSVNDDLLPKDLIVELGLTCRRTSMYSNHVITYFTTQMDESDLIVAKLRCGSVFSIKELDENTMHLLSTKTAI